MICTIKKGPSCKEMDCRGHPEQLRLTPLLKKKALNLGFGVIIPEAILRLIITMEREDLNDWPRDR